MTRLAGGLLAIIALTLTATGAAAQSFRWPDNPKNLKVLPDSIRGQRLGQVMRGFSGALGVRCEFCHVGEGDLSNFDFESDEKPAKHKARVMLEMVQAINGSHLSRLAALGASAGQAVAVTCETCHRGVSRPVPLRALLLDTIDSAGVDAAVARYGELRKEYFGSAAYDFSRGTLTAVAERLIGQESYPAAVTIMRLELEQTGEDMRTLLTLGTAEVRAGQRDAGRKTLERALALAPENAKPFVQRQIDRILQP